MAKTKAQGHVAVIIANTIFGLSVPVTNDLVGNYLSTSGYMLFRCSGAAIIFWIISLFVPKEKVARRDLVTIVLGGMIGMAISQTFAALSLSFTQPVYFSLMGTLTPIATMLLAALFISEKITPLKLVGVVIGICGALLMVMVNWNTDSAQSKNDLLGIFFAFMSLITWAIYLIITRKVSAKYSSVTQMKWVFLASFLLVIPMGWLVSDIMGTPYVFLTPSPADHAWTIAGEMSFVVVFATVMGFFFIPYAMARLQATTVSVYTNLQPIVASILSFALGVEALTWDKPVAGVLVLLSAYLVTVAANKKEKSLL